MQVAYSENLVQSLETGRFVPKPVRTGTVRTNSKILVGQLVPLLICQNKYNEAVHSVYLSHFILYQYIFQGKD